MDVLSALDQSMDEALNTFTTSFLCKLADSEEHLTKFRCANGPSMLVELLKSPLPSLGERAQDIILCISAYIFKLWPQEQVCIDIFLEFFRATERFDTFADDSPFVGCRTDLVNSVVNNMPSRLSSVGHFCDTFMQELAGCFNRQINRIKQEGNVSADKIIDEINNFVKFSKHIYHLGSEAPLKEINKLIQAADDWFEKISEDQKAVCWTIFPLLRLLHKVAKYDSTVRERLSVFYSQRRATLNMLIQEYADKGCSCGIPIGEVGVFCDRSFLTFDSREIIAISLLPDLDEVEQPHFVISRNLVLSHSYFSLMMEDGSDLSGGVSIEFKSEEATGPGVLREWFYLVCKELFNPKLGFFMACPEDKTRFYPNHESRLLPYFLFCGRVIALALMHDVKLDVKLARSFFNQLAKREITWEDAKDVDPELYDSCKKIMGMEPHTVDDLCLTFDIDVCSNGSVQSVELCPGGRETSVNSNNRLEYLNMLVQKRLGEMVKKQTQAFADGFREVLEIKISNYLEPLDLEDLDKIMFGKHRNICLEDWKLHTDYHGYTCSDDEIHWFWKVVEGMKDDEQRKFLFFWASIQHLPSEGFSLLSTRFEIHKAEGDHNFTRLPTAHTCFYQLNLPPYPSYQIMYDRLHSITGEHLFDGFGLE